MKTLTDWAELLEAVQPFLASTSPLEAMREAGFVFGGSLGESIDRGRPAQAVDPRLVEELQRDYPPPPSMRLYVGRPRPVLLSRAGGYRAIVSGELGLLNEILAELWRVRTIPNVFDQKFTKDHLITVSELRGACDGVPNDATEATLYITMPPTASPITASPQAVHFDIGFRLALNSATPAWLEGTIGAELPLDFEIIPLQEDPSDPSSTRPFIRLTLGAINELTAATRVSQTSPVQPKAGSGFTVFNQRCIAALRAVLLFLIYEKQKLLIPAQIGLGSTFPNSRVTVSQVGAVALTAGGRDFAIAGINVRGAQPVDPSALITEELPVTPTNIHIAIDQDFASDVLSAAIDSGDMAAFINRRLQNAFGILGLQPAPVVVSGGSVTFDTSGVRISVDCVWQGACNFGTDLGFTVNIDGTLSIVDGRLTIEAAVVGSDVSTWDELKCLVLAIPGFGTLATILVEGILENFSYFLQGRELSYPGGGTSHPLPGSEKVVQIIATQAALSPGTLKAEGQARLISDPDRTYIYLRLMLRGYAPDFQPFPLVGASVEYLEVHDFAQVPPTSETDTFTHDGKFEITTDTEYRPLPDVSLGTARTNDTGYVAFAVVCPLSAGVLTTTRTTTATRTGASTTTTSQEIINEGWLDLAITVTDAGGTRLTTRRIVGTSIVNKRLGSHDVPLVVVLPRPDIVE